MKKITLTMESLSPSGHSIATSADDEKIYVLGAFPKDVVDVSVYKKAEGKTYAEIIRIREPSEDRTHTPVEKPFFDANAPWRWLESSKEQEYKKEIIQKIFKKIADIDISSDIQEYGIRLDHYRNKAAYSFMKNSKRNLCFALYPRGTQSTEKVPQGENILVHEKINQAGKQFLHFFNQKSVPLETLKYLTLRYSYTTNRIVAQILVTETNRKKLPWKKTDLENFLKQNPVIQGVIVSHSAAYIRSSTTTKDFYELGNIIIEEKLLGKTYRYHPSQFFQIYPEAFEFILEDVAQQLSLIENNKEYELVDLFSGVGVIGLHLAESVNNVLAVEYSPMAKKYAEENATLNNINNFSCIESPVEQALDHIKKDQILVVDPPRSGLSKQMIQKIQEVQPKHLFYVSCDPETQARDYRELRDFYEMSFSKAYNLFPKTSHVEHFIVLKRK